MTASEAEMALAVKDAEIARLRSLIDRDRTGLAQALVLCLGVVRSYGWMASEEGEWGCYGWDERTEKAFREEVDRAFDEIATTATDALRESGRRAFEAFHPDLAKRK